MAILWLFPVAGVAMVLVGLGLLLNGARRSRDWKRFVARAQVAEAEVVELRRRTVRDSDGPTSHAVLVPLVRFTTADGEVVESLVQYVGATAGVRPGERFPVRYDPADPRRVNPLHGPAQGSTFGCAQLVVGIGLVLIGAVATFGTVALVLSIQT